MFFTLLLTAALTYTGSFTQGGMVEMTAPKNSIVYLDQKQVDGFNGKYFLTFDRDAPASEILTIIYPDAVQKSYTVPIQQREWPAQNLTQVDENITSPSTPNKDRMDEETLELATAQIQADAPCNPNLAFAIPINAKITAPFGVTRSYNGKPGSPHGGVDFAAPVGTPFTAPESGTVIFLDDLFLSGKTLLIDHGCNITSTFMHLDHTGVKVGDRVQKGEVIGYIGRTGLVTGPHLHWGVEIGQTRLDPMLLIK